MSLNWIESHVITTLITCDFCFNCCHGVYTLRNTAKINAFSRTNNAIIGPKYGVREEGTFKIRREKYQEQVRYFKISVHGTRCYHNYMSITPWCIKTAIYSLTDWNCWNCFWHFLFLTICFDILNYFIVILFEYTYYGKIARVHVFNKHKCDKCTCSIRVLFLYLPVTRPVLRGSAISHIQ